MKKVEAFDIWEMVTSFQKGEEKGFTFFFKSLRPALVYYAHKIVNDGPVAEDVVEESFIKLWERHVTFAHPQVIKSWMYTTVRNACINRLQERKRKLRNEANYIIEIGEMDEEPCINKIIETETLRLLNQAIDELPTECRKVFDSLYIKGNTVRDTADEFGLAITTIKNQKGRGLMILRSIIKDEGVLNYAKIKGKHVSSGQRKRSKEKHTRTREIRNLLREKKTIFQIASAMQMTTAEVRPIINNIRHNGKYGTYSL